MNEIFDEYENLSYNIFIDSFSVRKKKGFHRKI